MQVHYDGYIIGVGRYSRLGGYGSFVRKIFEHAHCSIFEALPPFLNNGGGDYSPPPSSYMPMFVDALDSTLVLTAYMRNRQ